jgi:hypothetical protein
VKLRSLVEGVDFLESLVSIKHLLIAIDVRHHHLFLFRSQNIIDPLRTKSSETLVDSNHRCRASIRTLNGPFWARCKLGFDHKPRSITIVTNLGLLGAAI